MLQVVFNGTIDQHYATQRRQDVNSLHYHLQHQNELFYCYTHMNQTFILLKLHQWSKYQEIDSRIILINLYITLIYLNMSLYAIMLHFNIIKHQTVDN